VRAIPLQYDAFNADVNQVKGPKERYRRGKGTPKVAEAPASALPEAPNLIRERREGF